MSLVETFQEDPTKRSNLHTTYRDSLFITEAPEYSTSEVLTGSAYRRLLLGIADKDVDLLKITALEDAAGKTLGNTEIAARMFSPKRGLGSPLRSGQHGSVPLRQLMPLVPEIARHACVLGKVRNRWFPGNLLVEAVGAGRGIAGGIGLLESFASSLAVGTNDDLVAQFVEQLFQKIGSSVGFEGTPPKIDISASQARAYRGWVTDAPPWPAMRFCQDLASIVELKSKLTRRQWVVLVEAALRLGLPAHVLWVCRANWVFWEMCRDACANKDVPTREEIEARIWLSGAKGAESLEVGRDAMPALRSVLERHVYARFGINLLLARLEDVGKSWSGTLGYDASNGAPAADSLRQFLTHVKSSRDGIDSADPVRWLAEKCSELLDSRTSLVRCGTGFTKNMLEFVRHSLGQIEAHDPENSSYDQSYFVTNEIRGRASRSSQWPVHLGPAMLIVLAHACANSQGEIPVSVEDFRAHLNSYGIGMPAGELASGKIGRDLQNLGLLVDSPDAAGGRLLVRPF